MKQRKNKTSRPTRIIALMFAAIIAVGTALLMLPVSS